MRKSILLFLGTISSIVILSAQGIPQKQDTLLLQDPALQALHKKDSIKGKMNEEANRHELLNASTFQAPRQIQIGLPVTDPGDFLVSENDIPVVYANMPQGPQSVWRPGDGAYSKVYLMSLTETLLEYGRVGYGTNSFLQNGILPVFDPGNPGPSRVPQGFSGLLNYRTNAYNKQQFDLSLSSPIGNGWYYAISTYQNFDPGYFKLPYNSLNNKLQLYRGSLTKVFNHDKGDISLTYRYAYTEDLFPVTSISPFLYNGSGKNLSHIDNIAWGNDFFGNPLGNLMYKNIVNGDAVNTSMQKAGINYSHNVQLLLHYNFKDNVKLKVSGRWNYVPSASVPLQICTETIDLNNTTSPTKYFVDNIGSATTNARYVQQWLSLLQHAFINDGMLRAELSKEVKNNKWLLGIESIHHFEDHDISSSFYNTSIEKDQKLLYTQMASGGNPVDISNINPFAYNAFYLYNVAGGYAKGHENRNAFYAHDTWQVRPNLKVDGGVRLDYINIAGSSLPYNFAPGGTMGSMVTDVNGNPVVANLQAFSHDYILPSLAFHINYNIKKNYGLLAEYSYAQMGSNMSVFEANAAQLPTSEQVKPQTVDFGRAGIFFNHRLVELVAVVTYIEKPKILQSVSTSYENVAANILEQYGIKTLGATLDMMLHPAKGFDFHTLVQYMSPKYENFTVTLDDNSFGGPANNPLGAGKSKSFTYNGNTVVGVPNWTIELDPSYLIDHGKARIWMSFRNYSKTYGSIMNSIVFKPHWESFGGVELHVNRKFTLGFNVENILSQLGLSGSVGGSEFLTKSDIDALAVKTGGIPMTGNYLRPTTFNFTCQIKF